MFDKICDWAFKDADWYEFWLPQSGFSGGLIAAGIVITIFILIFSLF